MDLDPDSDPDPQHYFEARKIFNPNPTTQYVVFPVSKFIVPDWGDIVDSGIGLSYTGSPAFVARRAGTTALCQS